MRRSLCARLSSWAAPKWLAAARGARGMALRALGQHADAAADLRIAAAHEDVTSDTLRALAAVLIDGGELEEGIAVYQRALETAKRSQNPLEIAGVHRDLGLLHAQRGRLHDAIHAWTAALSIFEQEKAIAQAARLYCDLGAARRALGQGARALKDFEQALTLLNMLDAADLETRGLVLSNAANAYAEHGDAESADAFFIEAIQIAQQRGDPLAESTRRGNYGWFLLQVGRPRQAISLLGQGLKLSLEHGLRLQHAVQTDNMGLAYTALGDSATALDYHRRALAEAEALALPFWIASIQINCASALIALGHLDQAKPLIDAALAYARGQEQVELLIRALLASAALALAEHRADAAAQALDEALTRAKRADLRRLVAEGLRLRSQQFAMQNAAAEAAAVWDEAAKLYAMLHMPQGKTVPEWISVR
jgi:tetratricopeptide (TPR) repeat protein